MIFFGEIWNHLLNKNAQFSNNKKVLGWHFRIHQYKDYNIGKNEVVLHIKVKIWWISCM